jgi:hypothetical protein
LLLIAREWFNPLDGLLGRPERFAIYTFVLLLAAMYLILRPAPFMFPKYYPPLVIPLALLAIDLLFATLRQERARYAIGLLVGIVIVYQIYAWVRPGMRAQDFIYNYYWIAAKDPLITWWMAVPLTFSLIGGVLVAWRARLRFMNLLAVASLAAMLGWQIQEVVLQAYVPYATTYYYGEHSLVEVTKFLHENLPAGTLIVAPKDVGYRVQDRMRYIELSAEPLQDLSRPDVHYLVTRTNDYYGNSIFYAPEVAAMVEKNYTNIATIQNFVVLQHVAAK